MNTDILHFYFLQYSRYEDLIYNINTQEEERDRYLLKIVEIERKMEYLFKESYGW